MSYTKKDELIKRIENNYFNYKAALRSVSREKLFEMAGRISAVTEAYETLTKDYSWDEECEIDFFLLFRDPLNIIAEAWESRRNEYLIDFDEAMFEAFDSDKTISNYPLIEGSQDEIIYVGEPDGDRIRFYGEI